MQGRQNNLDFLRQFAAFLVILGHSQSLVGLAQYQLWGHGVATWGVLIFFSLSGYLVAQSWERDPTYLGFLAKRSLRIFPALALCVILTIVIVGPAFTTLALGDYFSHPTTRAYAWNIFLLPRYHLPGVFADNTYQHAVNGSLWSLPVEFCCYLLLALLAFGSRKVHPVTVLLTACLLFAVALWYYGLYGGGQIVVWGTDLGQATSIMPFFMMGALLCTARHHLPLRWEAAVAMVLGLVALDQFFPTFPIHHITWIFIPYVVLTVGWASTPVLRRAGRFGDPSYGMYLYAFPVQQIIVHLYANNVDFVTVTVLTTIVCAILGLLSWHFLEKAALRLKPGPRTATAIEPSNLARPGPA